MRKIRNEQTKLSSFTNDKILYIENSKLGMVVHTFNPSIQETQAGGYL